MKSNFIATLWRTVMTPRASYQRINPNLRLGSKPAPKSVDEKTVSYVRVLVPNRAKPVSTFRLTLAACAKVAQVIDSGLSAFEIHARLSSGKPVNSFWNNQPAILKI
jgi:hypothetical protein